MTLIIRRVHQTPREHDMKIRRLWWRARYNRTWIQLQFRKPNLTLTDVQVITLVATLVTSIVEDQIP